MMLEVWVGARTMAHGILWGKRRHHMGQGGKGRARAVLALVTCCHAAGEAGLDRG